MIEVKKKQILIDGKPVLIMCGEIHYFRLPQIAWQKRIDLLKESGCNAVATYVPWVCHEEIEGEIDLTGETREELDLVTFIELCKNNGLYFFLRPGPFIMAEMKNEGIPYWVLEQHPEIVPTTWDGRLTPNKTVDYLAPNFLRAVDKWYKAIMKKCLPYFHNNGGNIIAVQLDNEIGMLTWVSNSPDLTDNVLVDFRNWLEISYKDELKGRYPFDIDNVELFREQIVSPKEEYAANLRVDLGYYNRNRYARYVKFLRNTLERYGARDVLYVINIHGTGGGRGLTFPIGISQLFETYLEEGYISGSDIYFGDLTVPNFQDLYLINTFMDAMHNEDQPLTSIEFNCGDGNFGDNLAERYDPSAADFKMRMCMAQGNRMINYYLFTGGYNYRMNLKLNDGNDRIAFTGERHGFAAPVNPEGDLSYTFDRTVRGIKAMMALSDKVATMTEEYDNISYGFIPDYYMTEYHYPKSESMVKITRNIEANRIGTSWEILAKGLLLRGYRFNALDIQNKDIDPMKTPVLFMASASYMKQSIQEKLANYVKSGGRLILTGQLPQYDLEGKACTILIDALEVTVLDKLHDAQYYYLSVYFDSYLKETKEIRTYYAESYQSNDDLPFMRVYGTDSVCGFEKEVGRGKVLMIGTMLNCNLSMLDLIFNSMGIKNRLSHTYKNHGIFMTTTKNDQNERFIHLLNLDGLDKEFEIHLDGKALFEGKKFLLQNRDGVMLPINLTIGETLINYSTAEVTDVTEKSISFRLTQAEDVISLKTSKEILTHDEYVIVEKGPNTYIYSHKHSKVDDNLTIYFK